MPNRVAQNVGPTGSALRGPDRGASERQYDQPDPKQTEHHAKKSLKASEVYSQAKQQQRRDYWQSIRDIAAEDLVFLDETGVNLAMVLLYARAPRGQRAYAQHPKGRGKNLSIIGAMSLKAGFLEGLSFTGGTPGDVFLWFIETLLSPVLWRGAVVVMDNLPAHKVDGVCQAIEAVGA